MGTKREFGIPLTETQLHILQGVAFLLLLVATVAGLLPLQRGLDARFVEMKEGVIDMVEDTLGRSITYSSISPSIFQYLEIRDLRVLDQNRRALVDLSRVRVRYRLFALLSDAPLEAFTEVVLENSIFDLDRDGDRELFELLVTQRATGSTDSQGVSLGSLKLRGRNLTVRWTAGDQRLEASRVFFSLAPQADGAVALDGRGDVRVDFGEESPTVMSFLEADLRVTANLATSWDAGQGRVRVKGLSSDVFSIDPITFQLSAGADGINLRKIQDKLPLDLSARLADSVVSVNIAMDNYIPSDHVRLRGDLAAFDYITRSSASGRLTVTMGSEGLDYDADIAATVAPGLLPFPAAITTQLSGDNTRANFAALTLDSEFGEFRFTGDVDLASFLPSGELRIRNMRTLTQDRLAGLVRFQRLDQALRVNSPLLRLGRLSLAGIDSRVDLGEGAARFSLSTTFAGAQWDNQLSLDGSLGWPNKNGYVGMTVLFRLTVCITALAPTTVTQY